MNTVTTTALPMTTELTLLAWSVVLLLAQIVLQAISATGELGLGYAMGPQDDQRKPTNVYAGRFKRALQNLLETYPAFVALALALTLTGKVGGWGATGTLVWFWARVVYVPLYALGIPVVRTLVWAASIAGLILMLIGLWA